MNEEERPIEHAYPGVGERLGPRPHEYDQPHGYARSPYSFDGKCLCNRPAEDEVHVELYPGHPNPRYAPRTIVEAARLEAPRWTNTLRRLGEDD